MEYELIVLGEKWLNVLLKAPEKAMGGWQTGRITLKNGEAYLVSFENAQYVYYVEGYESVPFSEDEIEEIIVTNENIDMDACRIRGSYVVKKNILRGDAPITKSVPKESNS